MSIKQALHTLTTRVHTEDEIQQAVLEVHKYNSDSIVCVISNAEKQGYRKVTVYENTKRVYCCDLPEHQCEPYSSPLNGLINRFNSFSRKEYVNLTN